MAKEVKKEKYLSKTSYQDQLVQLHTVVVIYQIAHAVPLHRIKWLQGLRDIGRAILGHLTTSGFLIILTLRSIIIENVMFLIDSKKCEF